MFKDYVIVDNILENPNDLIDLSKKIDYFRRECDMIENISVKKYQIENVGWKGFRSEEIHTINESLYRNVMDQIFHKIFNLKCKFLYNAISYLHFCPESIVKNDSWWHVDKSFTAGVIYLNKNPPKDSGTILFIDGKKEIIENKFNRLVFYKSNILHTPHNGFGKTIDDARLTFSFFITKLALL